MNPNTQILLHCNETIIRLADNCMGVYQAALNDSNIPWQYLQSNLKFWRFKCLLPGVLHDCLHAVTYICPLLTFYLNMFTAQINRKTTMWLSLDPSIEAQWLHGEKKKNKVKKRQEKSSQWSQYILLHWSAIKSHCQEHMSTLLGERKIATCPLRVHFQTQFSADKLAGG